MAGNFNTTPGNTSVGASQAVRRNAADNGWEAFNPISFSGPMFITGNYYDCAIGTDSPNPFGTGAVQSAVVPQVKFRVA